jgi:hypothetical protein
MPDITVHKRADLTLTVIDGDPPADQSALIAQLNAAIRSLDDEIMALRIKIANAQAALA